MTDIDLNMMISFLGNSQVKSICAQAGDEDDHLNLNFVWSLVLSSVSEVRIRKMSVDNLSVFTRTIKKLGKDSRPFWIAVNQRLVALEDSIPTRSYCMIAYELLRSGHTDPKAFVDMTIRHFARASPEK
jgi:hypothetical protein